MKLTEQSDYEEVKLKKDGKWSPKVVVCTVSLANVLSVETKLESSNDIFGIVGEQMLRKIKISSRIVFIEPLLCRYIVKLVP